MGKGRSRRRKQRKRRSKQDSVCVAPAQDPPVALKSDSIPDGMAIPLDAVPEELVISKEDDELEAAPNRKARRKAKRKKAKAKKRRGLLVSAGATVISETACADEIETRAQLDEELEIGDSSMSGRAKKSKPRKKGSDDYLIDENTSEPVPDESEPIPALVHRPLPGDQPELNVECLAGLLEEKQAEPIAELASKEQAVPAQEDDRPPWEVNDGARVAALPRMRALTDPNAKMLTKLKAWILSTFGPRPSREVATEAQHSVDQLLSLQSDLAAIQKRLDRMIAGAPK